MAIDWRFLLTSFDGRITRAVFWIGAGAVLLANVIGQWFIAVLFGNGLIGGLLALLYGFATTFAAFAVMVKRCHDRGRSGWWSLLIFVPVIGLIWMIVDLGMLPGQSGPNRSGADPRAPLEPMRTRS